MENQWEKRRKRIHQIIEIGNDSDYVSRGYDILSTLAVIANLAATVIYTFADLRQQYGTTLLLIDGITVAFFTVDYFLRIWTEKYSRPDIPQGKAILKYAFSFTGIIDLLSFLPYFLPMFFPSGAVAFRMFRVVRIFRLFRINAYYDSLNVITEVIIAKKQQLLSSVFIILTLMLASSLCMYSLEHNAQPDVFSNAFSGVWWSVSTLLTVGYGDIYPITTLGKTFGIFITFLGVGMVAIPTGIISAGFVDYYSRIKRMADFGAEEDIHFIKIHLDSNDTWCKRKVSELGLPTGILVVAIKRSNNIIMPKGDVILYAGDILVLGAEPFHDKEHIELKEVVLKQQHPWNGKAVSDLDISRKTMIVMVKRKKNIRIPGGDFILQEGDTVILYTQKRISDSVSFEL